MQKKTTGSQTEQTEFKLKSKQHVQNDPRLHLVSKPLHSNSYSTENMLTWKFRRTQAGLPQACPLVDIDFSYA